jgi:hypothetical protein
LCAPAAQGGGKTSASRQHRTDASRAYPVGNERRAALEGRGSMTPSSSGRAMATRAVTLIHTSDAR